MRAIVCETRTGSYVADLDVSAWSYDIGILAPDKCEVTVPAYTRRALSMDLLEKLEEKEKEIIKEVSKIGWIAPTDVDGCSSNCKLNSFNNMMLPKKPFKNVLPNTNKPHF